MLMLSAHLPSTRTLQCFLAVAQELNFRSAAELLHMSQPPLTRQIQGLEALLGVRLIERDTRRVRLTGAGEAFRAEAYRILAALDAAVDAIKALRADAAPRIGVTCAINPQALPALAGLLDAGDAGIERDMSRHLVERVRDGTLDLALVGDIAAPAPDLYAERLGSETMVAMLPSQHPAARGAVADFTLLHDTPLFWFSRSDNPAFYDKCEHAFRSCGYAAPRRAEPRDFSLLLAAVAAGDGIGLCPQSLQATTRAGVVYLPLPDWLRPHVAIALHLLMRAGEARAPVLELAEAWRRAFAAQAPRPRIPSGA